MEQLKSLFPNIDCKLLCNYKLDFNNFEKIKSRYKDGSYTVFEIIEKETGDQYATKSRNIKNRDFNIERDL